MNNNDLNELINQLKQIDFSPLTEILPRLAIIYVIPRVLDNYTFHKDYQPKNIKKITLPPQLTEITPNIDSEYILKQQFSSSLITFIQTIQNNFSKKDLNIFYNNINELKISTKNFRLQNLLFQDNTNATYDISKNKILLNKDDYLNSIYHELFHMASSLKKNSIYYSGFCQASLIPSKIFIGIALTEGYTELLNDRYFNKQIKHKDYYNTENYDGAYPLEVYTAYKLEQIIGQNKMKSLYLNANLSGLINELKQYSTDEEIIQFITSTDFIHKHINKHFTTPKSRKMIIKSFNNIGTFLAKAYTNKLNQQLNNNIITKEEANEQLSSYLTSLTQNGTYYEKGEFYPQEVKEYYSFISSQEKEQYYQTIYQHYQTIYNNPSNYNSQPKIK